MKKKKEIKHKSELTKTGLNLEQEKFCQLYAGDVEFFGNGVESYVEAYNINLSIKGAYNSARVNACQLLTKTNILKRIDEILESDGFNNEFVDKQLKFVLTQHADLSAKIQAIREYNKLKQRIIDKSEVLNKIDPKVQQNIEAIREMLNGKKTDKEKG